MTNSQRLAAVRLRLEQWLAEHTECSDQAPIHDTSTSQIHKESFLIRDGFYCGRQFDTDHHRAVWFMEEDELKIYSHDGNWICSLQGEALTPQRDDEHLRVIPLHAPPESNVNDVSGDEEEIRRAA